MTAREFIAKWQQVEFVARHEKPQGGIE